LSEVSSETIGILGVIFFILLVIILLTSKSPLLTGVLSDFISLINPFSRSSNEISPAYKKVSINSSVIFFKIK
jgi:hypothetical protein